jgi:hypothetical protein
MYQDGQSLALEAGWVLLGRLWFRVLMEDGDMSAVV